MQSVMSASHQFSMVPHADIERSSFDRSHGHKTTFDSGFLIPVFVDEALPGDTFNLSMTAFARLATPIKPVMDNMFMNSFFFFVPNRLIYDDWQHMMGEQDNPGDSTDFVVPQITAPAGPGYAVGDLADYMGIPTGVSSLSHSALWMRAYNLIWNSWFRDQNLQDAVQVPKGAGPDNFSLYVPLRRGKRHDYFTSCLPWPQKDNGNPVLLPLGSSAPVTVSGNGVGYGTNVEGNDTSVGEDLGFLLGASTGPLTAQTPDAGGGPKARIPVPISFTSTGTADLSAATSATINAIREAFQLQRLYERDARGGTRYTEIVRSHFGVVSPDSRLQRPEYLGGGESPVGMHPIAQTSATVAGVTPQGNLSAFSTTNLSGHGFTKSFTEHGVIIGLVSVRADLSYQQGLNRMWSRSTRWDYFWPALAHLGEQAVLNKEIFADGSGSDDLVFGYQERYAEYRYKPSLITGQFRSTFAQSLDVWHLAQDFALLPVLGDSFIQDNPPIGRVIQVPTEPQFLFDSFFNLKCARPMPVYSVPGMIDHF
nr:MAG: major capsid protein [Microviridae sp.]